MNQLELTLVHTHIPIRHRVDPFYAYAELTKHLGAGQAFLLDAAADSGSLYNMSLVAVNPILEVQVKDGIVHLAATRAVGNTVGGQLDALGYRQLHGSLVQTPPQPLADASAKPITDDRSDRSANRPMATVIDGCVAVYEPEDCMVFLEDLRRMLRSVYGEVELPPFAQGFLGYIGYDAVHYLERLPKTTVDDRNLPDIRLQWHATVIHVVRDSLDVYSAVNGETENAVNCTMKKAQQWAISPPAKPSDWTLAGARAAATWTEDVPKGTFEASVAKAKGYICAGDIFQVVLSKRIRAPINLHPYDVYDKLRNLNPSPYMFVAEYPDCRLLGASPEVQFRCVRGEAEMKPIAGTSKGRGRTEAEDLELRQRLLNDEKERAEHLMLVDLCRNDLGRVSTTASVQVTEFMAVEPYSHLFHLVSTVRSRLHPDVSVFQALLATFPAGTLSGAPKIRAMEIIDELETYRRGPYGGMLGMIDFDANANTAIVIRTIVERNGEYFIQVGAGIVADSNPEQEWLECGHKAGALLAVLGGEGLTLR